VPLFRTQYINSEVDDFYEHTKKYRKFQPGAIYPPVDDIERVAKYRRGRTIFNARYSEPAYLGTHNVLTRASDMLRDTPHAAQLDKLYIAVNLMDILITKPADLMVGEPPQYESGFADDSLQQKAINRIAENNDLTKQIHESVIGSGYRGDAWFKVRYGHYRDFSALPDGAEIPDSAETGSIIEHVRADYVFPETSRGNVKSFKAVNIAWVEWVETKDEEIPYLNVERHLPGFIVYERFKLYSPQINSEHGVPIQLFTIGEEVPTGRDEDVVATGVPHVLVHHAPYKAVDDDWRGVSGIEKLETVLAAINDRLVQIDYILWKHSDPTLYGPDIEGSNESSARFGGRYIPMRKDDPTPGAITWNGHLDQAFKELDLLIGFVFQMSETPQWLFGTTTADDKGGTGTSHTDGEGIKSRFMPIISKIKRIRTHYDKAVRDALWTAQLLDNAANQGVLGFAHYDPVYPTISWKDGLPRDEKTLAETQQINTGGKPVVDQLSAIKKTNGVDDERAREILARIEGDEQRMSGTVDGSVFNREQDVTPVVGDDADAES
jgi:hypothetical protein